VRVARCFTAEAVKYCGIMPPHCDSLDGPVVAAARRALDAGDVDLVLPFVPEQGETEVRDVFQSTVRVRELMRTRERSQTGCSSRPSYAFTGPARVRPTPG
jgi:hypothetical protein